MLDVLDLCVTDSGISPPIGGESPLDAVYALEVTPNYSDYVTRHMSLAACRELYLEVLRDDDIEAQRQLCLNDLFFLLCHGLRRIDADTPWLYARTREVEADIQDILDLWAREHYKSTIKTFARVIQEVLRNPDATVGIFSHKRPVAKGFLQQIKLELESNTYLQDLFPDVLFREPQKDSPRWSLDDGIIVRRRSNPKESTVAAWGLVDGQPVGHHYSVLAYDDVVMQESVTTPEQIKKTTEAWELSLNLGTRDGARWYTGTPYHCNDTYVEMIKRGAVRVRRYAATHDATPTGKPVFLTAKQLATKRQAMGPYVFGCQMLMNPVADSVQNFKEEWLKRLAQIKAEANWSIVLLGDPANEKKKTSDYTVFEVIGLAPDGNYYLLDAVRARYNLTERTNKLIELHQKWRPVYTGYEQYGKDSDIQHIEYVQNQINYRFVVHALGGSMPKPDRIRRLVPDFDQGRVYIPNALMFLDHEGVQHDFIHEFVTEEYLTFPVCSHDDMLDCMARVKDIPIKFPQGQKAAENNRGKARQKVQNTSGKKGNDWLFSRRKESAA